MSAIWLAFITGLTTGGISCLAVQGGLLASTSSQRQKGQTDKSIVGMFLLAKLLAYTLLGFVLGAVGSVLTISSQLQGWMQIFAGLYMLATAANLLNINPIFRYAVIQPPRFAYKFIRKESKAGLYFSPALLGAMTVFIPCGITQGMMVLAVASSNAITGAGILFAFTLGTSPVFGILGLSATKLMKRKTFLYVGATLIIILGLLSINTGQVLRGSVHTFQNYWQVISTPDNQANLNVLAAEVGNDGEQSVTITVTDSGYTASANTLKIGIPVRLKLTTNNTYGCARAFRIPSLGIAKTLPLTGEETVEFTPTKLGLLTFTCSMGMYTGSFTVVD